MHVAARGGSLISFRLQIFPGGSGPLRLCVNFHSGRQFLGAGLFYSRQGPEARRRRVAPRRFRASRPAVKKLGCPLRQRIPQDLDRTQEHNACSRKGRIRASAALREFPFRSTILGGKIMPLAPRPRVAKVFRLDSGRFQGEGNGRTKAQAAPSASASHRISIGWWARTPAPRSICARQLTPGAATTPRWARTAGSRRRSPICSEIS